MKRRRTIPEQRAYESWLALPAAIVIGVAIRGRYKYGSSAGWTIAAISLTAVTLAYWLYKAWVRRKRRRALVECDWNRCLYCFFDLRGLPPFGNCPECGEEYDIDEVRNVWQSAPGHGQQ